MLNEGAETQKTLALECLENDVWPEKNVSWI
jgi:hypothetical protein